MKPTWWRCFQFACALAVMVPVFAANQSVQAANPRIGLLTWWPCDQAAQFEFGSFVRGLEDLGYKPGETVTIVCESADKRYDDLVAAAARLVRLPVDVIVTSSQPAGRAARAATDKTPIVSVVSGNPIAAGLARSLAKPGGNFTGVSYYATELSAKRLELLKEAIPGLIKIGVLANPDVAYLPFEADTKQAADRLGIALAVHQVNQPADLDAAFVEMKAESVQAVFVLPDIMLAGEAQHIAALAIEHRLPTMAWGGWYTQAGCLMAYSANYDAMNYRLAFYVDRILKGANPGDLPIEQPTTFKLSINLKTAGALGLELPQTILLLADDVIE